MTSFKTNTYSIKSEGKSFYWASFFLPKKNRIAASKLYSICRYLDDVADSSDEEDPGKEKLYKELKEYKDAVYFLRNKLHEVNLLNAKLLFTNKLFKEFALTNDEKMRVVETFDRTQSTREIKLVYTTLAESYKSGSTKRKTRIKESASKKSGSTKPSKQSRKVITEETQVVDRFRKLAGIIN